MAEAFSSAGATGPPQGAHFSAWLSAGNPWQGRQTTAAVAAAAAQAWRKSRHHPQPGTSGPANGADHQAESQQSAGAADSAAEEGRRPLVQEASDRGPAVVTTASLMLLKRLANYAALTRC